MREGQGYPCYQRDMMMKFQFNPMFFLFYLSNIYDNLSIV